MQGCPGTWGTLCPQFGHTHCPPGPAANGPPILPRPRPPPLGGPVPSPLGMTELLSGTRSPFGLPAEPPPSSTAAAAKAATPPPPESSTEPTRRLSPDRGVSRRIAVGNHRPCVRCGRVRPGSVSSDSASARQRVHVAWDKESGAVPGRPAGHRPPSKGPCSIACWHRRHLLPVFLKAPVSCTTAFRYSFISFMACRAGDARASGDVGRSSPASRMRPGLGDHR